MSDFGKLNFSISFNPTSAFPLDARCYFTNLSSAEEAAATAEEVGSTNTVYHYGMKLLVDTGETATWYTIQRDGTLLPDVGQSQLDEYARLTGDEIEALSNILMNGTLVCEPVIEGTYEYWREYESNYPVYCYKINATITGIDKALIKSITIGHAQSASSGYWYSGATAVTSVDNTTHTAEKIHKFEAPYYYFNCKLEYYTLYGEVKTLTKEMRRNELVL